MLCLCARERDLPHCGRPGGRRFKYFNHRSWHCCDRRQGRNLVVTDPTMRTRTARQLGLRAVLAARLLILLFRLQMLFTFPPGSYTPGATYKWYAFAINEAGGKSSASAAYSFTSPAMWVLCCCVRVPIAAPTAFGTALHPFVTLCHCHSFISTAESLARRPFPVPRIQAAP